MPSERLDPMFIWVEMNRRVDDLSARLDRMDENGTRGVDGLRIEVRELRVDLNAHEDLHRKSAEEQATARRWFVGLAVSGVLALLANPLLVLWLTRG